MKSIDYLKLVSTATNKGWAAPLSVHDKALWAAIAYGIVGTFILTMLVAIAASVLGVEIERDFVEISLAGLFLAIVYLCTLAWLLDTIPKLARLLIAVPLLVLVAWLTKDVFLAEFEFWYLLVPLTVYCSLVAALAFRQFAYLIRVDNSRPEAGKHAE